MEDLGTQLRDLHAPDPVSWWPPAPGWWLVAAVVLTLLALALPYLGRGWRRRRLRRAIRAELEALHRARSDEDVIHYLLAANQLLRRVALSLASRDGVAALHGTAWVDRLDALGAVPLPAAVRQALAEDCYRGRTDVTITSVHAALRRWVAGLHLPPRAGGAA
ncbi:MAG: DUF4381 domain-containing protein [Gammaproteobacteria bacterium]|nr:DUF4381 domain-containing protein [Gammaproteobacteria bacterium]